MKKLTASLFAATVLSAGLAGVAPSAQAAPYPGSQDTGCDAYAIGKPNADSTAKIRSEVTNKSESTGEPKGFINVRVEKLNGADSDSGRFFTRGGAVQFQFGPLKPGRYVGSMEFNAKDGSKWADCSASFDFRVRRHAA